jgi:hypothetical protein
VRPHDLARASVFRRDLVIRRSFQFVRIATPVVPEVPARGVLECLPAVSTAGTFGELFKGLGERR